jgi:hypothetical protein
MSDDDALPTDFGHLRAAAKLRARLDLWERDRAFEAQGGRILYAVDTDVVKLFLDPGGMKRYAAVFDDEEDPAREVLAWVLARYIFERLTKTEPLLLIPGHNLELETVIAGIDWNASSFGDRLQRELQSLSPILEKFRTDGNQEALIQGIEDNALGLVRQLYGGGEGPVAEARRMARLLERERLLHMERYIDERDGWVLPALLDDLEPTDRKVLDGLMAEWRVRLKQHKSSQRPEHLIDWDAEALARLQWANSEAGNTHRLILISGDRSLHRAARDYEAKTGFPVASRFLREPRTFMAAAVRDLLPERTGDGRPRVLESGLIDWLDLLFSRFDPDRPGYLKRLRKSVIDLKDGTAAADALTEQFARDNPQWVSRLRGEWSELIKLAAVNAGLVADRDLVARAAEDLPGLDMDQLRDTIEDHIDDARRDLWVSGMKAGFWSTYRSLVNEQNAGAELPSRGVPALRFPHSERFDAAKRYARYLVRTLRREPPSDEHVSPEQLGEADPSGYSLFLVHALGFAVAARWATTALLAKIAVEIADDLPGSPPERPTSEIRGTDAAYLQAIALRHCAKRPDDLELARRSLKDAGWRAGSASDLRMEVEGVALDLAYQHFRLFSPQSIPDKTPSLADCQRRLLELYAQLKEEADDTIRDVLEKRVLTNIFSVLLLRRYKESAERPEAGANVSALLGRFRKILDQPQQQSLKSVTCLTKAVYLAGCQTYGNASERLQCSKGAEEFWEAALRHPCAVMPYDKQRFAFLQRVWTQQREQGPRRPTGR